MKYTKFGTPLPTPAEMAAWEAASAEVYGISPEMLMENASREAFHAIRDLIRPGSTALVAMGGGNNGGDGAALARRLLDAGMRVLVCHTHPLESLSDPARRHATIARKTGVPFIPLSLADGEPVLTPEWRRLHSPDLVVDALLGTGLSGPVRDGQRQVIEWINDLDPGTTVISLDVPSGLDALTGLPRPVAVRADRTVTFEAATVGLAWPHARPFTGELVIREIGIPAVLRSTRPPSFYSLGPTASAWPEDTPDMHKGTAGRVIIFGGSRGLTGAPALSALGALRSGAGLVTIACPGGLESQVRHGFPEIMTQPLGQGEEWSEALLDEAGSLFTRSDRASIVVGPGMGRGETTGRFVAGLIRAPGRPRMVLDADGLYFLSADVLPELLGELREDDCITPHPGEAARLLGLTTDEVQTDRAAALRRLTAATKATVALKGSGTLIANAASPVFLAPFAVPALATGGTGDVLSGVAAAFLARLGDREPAESALKGLCLAVYAHGKAGEIVDARYPARGGLTQEIADAIPRARAMALEDL